MTPTFKIGFELELNIPPTYATTSELFGGQYRMVPPKVPFWKGITEIPGLSKVVEGYDYHNDPGMRPAEIRTPPQPIGEGITSFFELLKYIAAFPKTDVYSTSRCGLHINLSEKQMMSNSESSLRFFNHIIQHYPEWAVMERFGREINPTCAPWFPRDTPVEDRIAARHPHWGLPHAHRSSKWGLARGVGYGLSVANKELSGPNNRIEFRGHGNTGYETKTDDLRFAIDKIIESATTAFNNTLNDDRPVETLITYTW